MTREWTVFDGHNEPEDEDILLDVKFDSGKELQNLYWWDLKWHGNNPGFGYVDAFRVSDRNRSAA